MRTGVMTPARAGKAACEAAARSQPLAHQVTGARRGAHVQRVEDGAWGEWLASPAHRRCAARRSSGAPKPVTHSCRVSHVASSCAAGPRIVLSRSRLARRLARLLLGRPVRHLVLAAAVAHGAARGAALEVRQMRLHCRSRRLQHARALMAPWDAVTDPWSGSARMRRTTDSLGAQHGKAGHQMRRRRQKRRQLAASAAASGSAGTRLWQHWRVQQQRVLHVQASSRRRRRWAARLLSHLSHSPTRAHAPPAAASCCLRLWLATSSCSKPSCCALMGLHRKPLMPASMQRCFSSSEVDAVSATMGGQRCCSRSRMAAVAPRPSQTGMLRARSARASASVKQHTRE